MSTCCASLPAVSCRDSSDSHPGSPANATLWLRLGLAALVSAQTMAFGLAVNLSPPEGSARLWIHGILATSVLLVFFLVGIPIVRESWRLFRERRIGLEQMFLTGIAGAFFASIHSTLNGNGPVFYEVVAILLAIYTFGSLLGQRRREAALQSAEALRHEFEFCSQLLPDGQIQRLPIHETLPGMRVQVLAGEGIPVDGIIESGSSSIHETPLTGEPFPVWKGPGDRILAGSKTLDQSLVILVESKGEDRRLDHLLRSVHEARSNPSGIQREADRLISWFLPGVLLISLLTFIGWTISSGWITGMFNALAVLVVACPCAMGLATPIGIWSALDALARRGLMLHSGDFIERLAKVDTVIFDKTGTLSEEDLVVTGFRYSTETNRDELKSSLAAIQRESNHPVARAFHSWITPDTQNYRVDKIELLPGTGIAAILAKANGLTQRLEIGNDRILSAEDRQQLARILGEEKLQSTGTRDLFIKRNGRCVATVCLREKLRSSTRSCLETLEKLGLKVEIMTGDTAAGTAAVGLEQAQTRLLPEDKGRLVRDLVDSGHHVLFVGDGINDSSAMSQAQASIALASGAELPNEIAQARLFGNNLETICESILVSRRVLSGIRQNLNIALVYNFFGIGLAAAGIIHPVLAALLMLASSSWVTWRALRFAEQLRNDSSPFSIVPPIQKFRPAWTSCLLGGSIALQGPVLSLLSGLEANLGIPLSLLSILLGFGVLRGFPKWSPTPTLQLAVGMLALGNLGMLLGWSAHAGFGAIIRDGVCLCGCAKSALGKGVTGFTWMQAGMLASSLPVFFLVDPKPALWKTLSFSGHAIICLAGMLAGMEFSAWTMSLVPTPKIEAQAQFFLTFFAMTCGMVLGMIAACRLYSQWLKRT